MGRAPTSPHGSLAPPERKETGKGAGRQTEQERVLGALGLLLLSLQCLCAFFFFFINEILLVVLSASTQALQFVPNF